MTQCLVNVGIGAYRTDEGKPYVLSCIKKAEVIFFGFCVQGRKRNFHVLSVVDLARGVYMVVCRPELLPMPL